jgi:hypothetical protein
MTNPPNASARPSSCARVAASWTPSPPRRRPCSANSESADRDKLDAWFTGVRDLEQRLVANEAWVNRPKPKVDLAKPTAIPRDNEVGVQRIFLDIVHMALATDSARFITLHVTGNNVTGIEGVDESYHNLSHHGMDDEKLRQLAVVEQAAIDAWGDFLRKLKGDSLLDETMVLLTSNLGNASSHDNKNMPVLFAGGGFQHGQHLAFDQKENYPLPNLYLSTLQRLGTRGRRLRHEHRDDDRAGGVRPKRFLSGTQEGFVSSDRASRARRSPTRTAP